jgi:Xaa-Pro aminopeptidase
MTEAEVAWRIEMAVRSRGAESISFDTIVGSGPNAALPHHRAGDRVLQQREPVVIDMGARYMGYCSDLTRTVVLGQPDETFKKVYDTVLGAQLTAIETVQAGMTGAEADRLARTVIEEAGYGEMFGHSLGHGVGLEVHENPGVGATSSGRLEDGMVFTIEPGIYLSGWGGVRIEDVVVLENGRARVLSRARKNESPWRKRTA